MCFRLLSPLFLSRPRRRAVNSFIKKHFCLRKHVTIDVPQQMSLVFRNDALGSCRNKVGEPIYHVSWQREHAPQTVVDARSESVLICIKHLLILNTCFAIKPTGPTKGPMGKRTASICSCTLCRMFSARGKLPCTA
jgi:hypothetical protein